MITLIGEKLARKGVRFLYCGPAENARTAGSGHVHKPLEEGMYIIRDVKDRDQRCPVHEERR